VIWTVLVDPARKRVMVFDGDEATRPSGLRIFN
jgi:hypothetical protein